MRTTIATMITTFQTSGEIAGIAKWSFAFSTPTSRPLRPSRITIGNSTRLSPTVSASSAGENSGPVKIGMITPASAMKITVITPSTARIGRTTRSPGGARPYACRARAAP